MRLAVTPSWHAGQACSGGAAGLGPPDASGAGAILSSQHSGHSTCGRPCRPCPCSHTKYAAPATSSRLRPPPKGSPGALGMRRCIAVHLSLDKAARPGTIAGAAPFQCDTIRPIDGKACRHCPRPPMWPASLTAAGSGALSPGRRSALVTLRYRPWSLIARGIRRSVRLWEHRFAPAGVRTNGRSVTHWTWLWKIAAILASELMGTTALAQVCGTSHLSARRTHDLPRWLGAIYGLQFPCPFGAPAAR